jgi:hypothetical protein
MTHTMTWGRMKRLAETIGSQNRSSVILGPAIASPLNTEVGTVCGNSARANLCEGSVMGARTALIGRPLPPSVDPD